MIPARVGPSDTATGATGATDTATGAMETGGGAIPRQLSKARAADSGAISGFKCGVGVVGQQEVQH